MDLLPKGSPVRLSFELRSFLDQYEIASDATRSCVARSNLPKLRLSRQNVTAAPSGQDLAFSEGQQSIFDSDEHFTRLQGVGGQAIHKAAKLHKPTATKTATNENGLLLEEALFAYKSFIILVPGGGVEPPRAEARRILSPLRLPVPPSRPISASSFFFSYLVRPCRAHI
jgi:hypothetical protein